jgi:hypothetical protein
LWFGCLCYYIILFYSPFPSLPIIQSIKGIHLSLIIHL